MDCSILLDDAAERRYPTNFITGFLAHLSIKAKNKSLGGFPMKKLLSLFLAAAVSCSMLAACGSDNTSSTPTPSPEETKAPEKTEDVSTAEPTPEAKEPIDCLYVIPGDAPKDLEGGLKAINGKMEADGVGVVLSMNFNPWDAWDQKLNLMLSTGEKFDMFQVMNDRTSLSNYASRDALADLTELVEQYGPNIKKANPELAMKSATVNGKLYAIPAYWIETALAPELTLRLDILKKYGMTEVPKTFEELTTAFETVFNNWEGVGKPYYPLLGSTTSSVGIADKTYDEWPFVVYDRVFYVDQKGNVENYFETDVFRKNCENTRLWYEKGLISPDVLTTTSDQHTNRLNSGDWFFISGSIGDIGPLKTNYPDITTEDFVSVDLAPEKPYVRPYGARNMNAVPLSSEHPEAAVLLTNWIYANQDNYDLFLYGREGTDYEKVEPRQRTPINDPVTMQPPYSFADWMIGNVNMVRTSVTAPKATNDTLYVLKTDAVDGYASSFTFNAEKVQTQFTDVQTQILAYITPIACGVKDYESNIDEALSMLKAAGADELIAEFKKQLEESKASN